MCGCAGTVMLREGERPDVPWRSYTNGGDAKVLACPLTGLESERIQQLHFSQVLGFANGNVL